MEPCRLNMDNGQASATCIFFSFFFVVIIIVVVIVVIFVSLPLNPLETLLKKNSEVYENSISGTIPSEYGNFELGIRFTLMDNELHGSIPTELGRLAQASFL